MSRLKLALFGSGRIGAVHFVNMITNQRANISWIVEVDVKRAEELVKKYNMNDMVKVINMEDADKVFSDSSVDGVLVCTPHDTHTPIVKRALAAGKPVFCEKPLALEFAQIKECYDLAKSKKLPLMCAFNRRFDPDFANLREKLHQGSIGKVRSVHVICRDPKSMMERSYLEVSGGIFKDSVVHEIDMANHLVGEQPLTVYATGHAHHSMYVECDDIDTAMVVLKYPCGAVAMLELSRWAEVNNDQRVEVLGSTGMLQAVNKRPIEVLQWNAKGVHQEPIYEGLDRYCDAYRLEVDHFIDVLLGVCELQVTPESTLAGFIIATACKVSLDNLDVIDVRKYAKDNFNYDIK